MTKYIAISLDDERAKDIAEIISNKTAKKILNILAEKELSESDIASSLNIPLNTVGYNIKKLVNSSLIEKTKTFFWSTRGKKIPTYKLANKSILISTKQKIKGILPAAVISFITAVGIKLFFTFQQNSIMKTASVNESVLAGAEAIQKTPEIIQASQSSNIWLFFLLGSLTALLIFLILNWRGK